MGNSVPFFSNLTEKVKDFSNKLDEKLIPESVKNIRKISGGEAINPAQDAKNREYIATHQNKVIDRNNYRDNSGNLNPLEYDRKIADVEQARKLKNPLAANSPQLMLAAHSSKLMRLQQNPKFQALDDQHKERVLKGFFDTFTKPILQKNGIEAPTFENWITGQRQNGSAPEKQEASLANTALEGEQQGLIETLKFVKGALHYKMPWTPKFTTVVNDAAAKRIEDALNGQERVNQDWHTNFNVHHGASGYLAGMGGNLVGTGPLYLAADAATGGLVEVPELAKIFGVSLRAAKALNYMREAGEFFGIGKTEGKTTKDAAIEGAVAPLIGMGANKVLGVADKVSQNLRSRILSYLNLKGTQQAVWGEPFTHTAAHEADVAEGTVESLIKRPRALLSAGDPDVKKVVESEHELRNRIIQEFFPDKVEAAGGKSVWRNLSKAQRDKIRTHIAGLSKASAETMPLSSPKVQTEVNAQAIENWAAENPQHKAIADNIAKLTGLDPAKTLTEVQAQQLAGTLNIGSPAQHIMEGLGEATEDVEKEFEPGEGASATLKPNFTVNFRNATNRTEKELVSDTAKDFINGTIKYTPTSKFTKSKHLYFEHPEHHLLYISKLSNAPPAVKARATVHLKNEFGRDIDQINTRAGWLREHINDLQKNIKQIPQKGNVYRSTKLAQRRYSTTAAKQLYTRDSIKTQVAELRGLLRVNPKLRKTIVPLLQELYKLKNAGQSPKVIAERDKAIESVVGGLKEMRGRYAERATTGAVIGGEENQ